MSVYAALAEPNRRRILDLLHDQDRSVNELVDELPVSQPGVSKHLGVLRTAGLVSVEKVGRQRRYSLSAAPLREVSEWLEPYRIEWSATLDRLEQHLEASS